MENIGFLPLKLQFFADGGEGEGAAQPVNTPNPPAAPAANPMTPEAIAEAFANAIAARTSRAERSVAKSFAEQYGLTEAEVTTLLEKAKADKAAAIPPEIQKQIDEAKERPEEQRFLWPCSILYLVQGVSTHSKRNCSGTQYSFSSCGPQLLEPMPF